MSNYKYILYFEMRNLVISIMVQEDLQEENSQFLHFHPSYNLNKFTCTKHKATLFHVQNDLSNLLYQLKKRSYS